LAGIELACAIIINVVAPWEKRLSVVEENVTEDAASGREFQSRNSRDLELGGRTRQRQNHKGTHKRCWLQRTHASREWGRSAYGTSLAPRVALRSGLWGFGRAAGADGSWFPPPQPVFRYTVDSDGAARGGRDTGRREGCPVGSSSIHPW